MDNFNNQSYTQNYNPTQNNYQNSDGRLNYPQSINNAPIVGKTQPISGWSWGASMFGWMWGLGNYTYMPFLAFIPFFGLFWWIVCGIKGHEWAYNSGHFKTVEEFNAVQESWNRAGKIYCIAMLIFLAVYIAFMFFVFGTAILTSLAALSEYSY